MKGQEMSGSLGDQGRQALDERASVMDRLDEGDLNHLPK
jgi:hypothetical protein